MLRPDLIEFKPKELAKSEEVNYNFEKMGDYVFGAADELKAFVNSAIANVNLQLNQSVFAGKIEMYAGNASDIPIGWLLCDGREVSRETYSNLYNKIGVKYGQGNGVTTFNVPNLIGRFAEGGTVAGIYKEAGLPDHYHNIDGMPNFSNMPRGDDRTGCVSYSITGRSRFASESNSIYGKSNTVQPPSVTVLYIIKT